MEIIKTFTKLSLVILSISALFFSPGLVSEKAESHADFFIQIPKIDLYKEIIPEVDPRNEEIYREAFAKGIAHGKGTKFPNEIGNTYLYAHSTSKVENIEKNFGWFTRLDELTIGDAVEITYIDTSYKYTIVSREIIDPKSTGVYTAYAPIQMLTLQTCFPRGETDKRLILKATLTSATPIISE